MATALHLVGKNPGDRADVDRAGTRDERLGPNRAGGVDDVASETDASASWPEHVMYKQLVGVHDLDACEGRAEADAGSDEPVLLGEPLQFGEYWLEITTSPEYVSPPVTGEEAERQLRFSTEPGLSRVRATEADSARADLSWEEFIGRGPVLTNALASPRLASLALDEGESVLLPVYWAEEIESWVAGLTFAVDRSGAVTAVGNCLNPMTAQIERLRRKAADGGADMTAREFLLTTPRETIATLEFG